MTAATRDNALEASIKDACKVLRLPTIGSRSGALAAEAVSAQQTHLSYLWALLEAELEDRGERRQRRRVHEARFPRLKTIDDFHFEDAPHIPAATIYELATGGFIERGEPVILIGEPGTGKSHLAVALGIAACMQSRRVRFTTAASLVNELIEGRDDHTLSKVIARYARYELVVLDELAYVPLGATEAELLFQVLDARAEVSATVITTNLPFGEWTSVFPEPRLCKAIVDRLTFNAHIVETGTESWRFRKTMERQQRKGARSKKA
ncbi:MAG: IS21-like element helper ATPase IstB [Actinomycetota bacterium]